MEQPENKKQRFEICAIVFALLVLISAALTGATGIRLGIAGAWSKQMGTGLFLIGGAAASLFFAVVSVKQKRPCKLMAATLVFAFSQSYLQLARPAIKQAVMARLDLRQRNRAVDWLSANRDVAYSSEHIDLPSAMRSLTENGLAIVASEGEHTWYVFPIVTFGLDNTIGFSWNKAGAPPPRTNLNIVRSERIRDGWYMWWST